MAAPAGRTADRRAARTAAPDDLARLRTLRLGGTAAMIATTWVAILLPAAAAIAWGRWPGYVVAAAWIGFRQITLFNVMHDAVHDLLHPERRWNDRLGDLFGAWPLGTTTARYRAAHLPHHRYLGSARDPDLVLVLQRQLPGRLWPGSAGEALRVLVCDLLGINFVRNLLIVRRRSLYALVASQDLPPASRADGDPSGASKAGAMLPGAAAAVLAGAGVLAAGGWLDVVLVLCGLGLVLWVVPLVTTFQVAMRLHQWGDHLGLEPTASLAGTRNVHVGLVERLLVSPNHSNYHLVHHLYPQVPSYNLRRLHVGLSADPTYRAHAPHAEGYVVGARSVLAELVAAPDDLHRRTIAAGRA